MEYSVELLILYQTSTVVPLKFVNGYAILSHTFTGHLSTAGIKVNSVSKWGRKYRQQPITWASDEKYPYHHIAPLTTMSSCKNVTPNMTLPESELDTHLENLNINILPLHFEFKCFRWSTFVCHHCNRVAYTDVTWMSWRLKLPMTRPFVQHLV